MRTASRLNPSLCNAAVSDLFDGEVRSQKTRTKPVQVQIVLWMIGTAARPDAILGLSRAQIDLDRGIVHLNPPGREQTKKYRPTVRLPPTLRAFVGDGTYILNYRGRSVDSIRTSWREQRRRCGFDETVNPYSLRHTMARHMRASSVPAWEVAAQLGHTQPGMAMSEVYAPYDPSYLSKAVEALDSYPKMLLTPPSERPLTLPVRCQSGSGALSQALVNMAHR